MIQSECVNDAFAFAVLATSFARNFAMRSVNFSGTAENPADGLTESASFDLSRSNRQNG